MSINHFSHARKFTAHDSMANVSNDDRIAKKTLLMIYRKLIKWRKSLSVLKQE
jgi:hypothetical protein